MPEIPIPISHQPSSTQDIDQLPKDKNQQLLFYSNKTHRSIPVANRQKMLFNFLFISLIIHLTSAVTIEVSNGIRNPRQLCTNIPPGICCRRINIDDNNFNYMMAGAFFENLGPLDIASVWARRGAVDGCSGRPMETHPGPGDWHYQAYLPTQAVGASYIRLPGSLPPDETEADWLTAEGMLGLVWGGGRWFAKGAEAVIGEGGNSIRFQRRGVVSGNRGKAYARATKYWKWPDMLEVEGVEYFADESVPLLYESVDGKVLNMTG